MLIRAAGAVAWRPGPDGEPEVLLVHRVKYDDWSLPKGKQEPGEYLPLTAVREVREEGGAHLTLGRRLVPVRYRASGHPKRVDFWAARAADADEAAVPNHEVDKAAWLPVPEARARVSYPQDACVLDDFATATAVTVPLILLRHAAALPRDGWQGDDAGRPLDEAGQADAAALAAVLSCFASRARVVSSPAVRCLDTVRPYAVRTGAPVRADPALAIGHGTDPAGSAALISALAAEGEPVVVCAHRENLPVLLAAAASALGEPEMPADWEGKLPKGGFWVLHMAAGELAGADRYDFPRA